MYASFDDADLAEDYKVLLQRASVTRRLALDQHDAWSDAMRTRAESDGLTVRTWSREGPPANVWAVLPDLHPTLDARLAFQRRISWLQEE